MTYDVVCEINDAPRPLDLEDIIDVLLKHPNNFVTFVGTNLTIDGLISWRGSYNIPALLTTVGTRRTGREIAETLRDDLNQVHTGWKGGEYTYDLVDKPYVTTCPSRSEEYKIIGYESFGDRLEFLTKIIPY